GVTAPPPACTVVSASPAQSDSSPTQATRPDTIASAACRIVFNARIAGPRLAPAPSAVTSSEMPTTSRSAFIADSAYPVPAFRQSLWQVRIRHRRDELHPLPDR